MTFALAPSQQVDALALEFASTGRVQLPDFLTNDGSERLYRQLRSRDDWRQVLNSGDKVFELDRASRAAMSDQDAAKLDAAVHAGARSGFQYRYESIRIDDRQRDPADLLDAFATFLSGGAGRDLLRKITGAPSVAFADAQATAFAPGDFLTGHDDDVGGKDRIAAYVLSLSPGWRVEWGGLLLFHGPEGSVSGFSPRFGTLNLFKVPQLHSVSMVTQAAALRRYSVTGWLRS